LTSLVIDGINRSHNVYPCRASGGQVLLTGSQLGIVPPLCTVRMAQPVNRGLQRCSDAGVVRPLCCEARLQSENESALTARCCDLALHETAERGQGEAAKTAAPSNSVELIVQQECLGLSDLKCQSDSSAHRQCGGFLLQMLRLCRLLLPPGLVRRRSGFSAASGR